MNEKINSMRRLSVLTQDLIRELIPEVGLRADFEDCLSHQRKSAALEKITHSNTNTESLTFNDDTFILSFSNSQFVNEKGNPLPVLQVESCKETDQAVQKKETTGTNSETGSFDSRPGSSISDTDNDSEYSASGRKRSRLKSNHEPNKRLASFKGLAHLKELNLETYLRTFDLKSEAAVENYKLKGTLNERDRSSITNAVVHEMLKVNYVPSQFEYAEIVKKICALFPSEDPAIYYIPPDTTHRNAQGKLPNKVKNIKYNLQKKDAGTVHLSPSSVQCALEPLGRTKIINPAKLEGSINKEDRAVKTAITCLRHESRDSWPQLLANWSVTHALRRKTLLETRPKAQCEANKNQEKDSDGNENSDEGEDEEEQLVEEYIKKWDVLTLPNGYLLLNQDFKELFPGREEGLFSKWEIAKELIIELAETEIPVSDIYGRDLLRRYHAAPADQRDVITLYLLPSLCCKRGRGKSTGYIPSVQEARKFFILYVTVVGDLRRIVKRHRAHFNAIGARLQPILIVVGQTLANITATYIQIDGVRYKLRTPVAALDACLKAYFALDVVYPQECKAVWYFVQHYFYNLYLEEDENISRVAGLISSLKGLASRKE